MNTRKSRFIVRWLVSIVGLWLATELLGEDSISYSGALLPIIISGFFLALVNTVIRPLVVFLTLPAVLLSLGIFMIVINALMIMLADFIYGPLEVSGFGIAVITGLVIGLVNWLVSAVLEDNKS